jgi:hypothetical protein
MGGRARSSVFWAEGPKDCESFERAPHRDWPREAHVPHARSERGDQRVSFHFDPVQFNGRASLLRLFRKSTCEVHKFTEEPFILQRVAQMSHF